MSSFRRARIVFRDPRFAVLLAGLLLGSNVQAQHADMKGDEKTYDWVRDWYALHPPRGVQGEDLPAATFISNGFSWNADGNTGTQVDTVRIWAGQTVRWQWGDGSHTTTSGSGAADPQAGALWDKPIHFMATSFQFQFVSSGTFRFFCRPHESFNMRGVVIVRAVSDVQPVMSRAETSGFVSDPWPNPATSTIGFRFAMQRPGRARLAVYDARGRLVATPLDRELEVGTWAGGWDRRTRSGEPAVAGVYFFQLELPGYADSRRIVVGR
jgi:plastocyanin